MKQIFVLYFFIRKYLYTYEVNKESSLNFHTNRNCCITTYAEYNITHEIHLNTKVKIKTQSLVILDGN